MATYALQDSLRRSRRLSAGLAILFAGYNGAEVSALFSRDNCSCEAKRRDALLGPILLLSRLSSPDGRGGYKVRLPSALFAHSVPRGWEGSDRLASQASLEEELCLPFAGAIAAIVDGLVSIEVD